mmetsp:Transcript_46999/g.130929  ORF Transcript_46999/g.130929 Transcript_46999/m.130929 type:complete len:377 (-) Transcript_46999:571-1701(-)
MHLGPHRARPAWPRRRTRHRRDARHAGWHGHEGRHTRRRHSMRRHPREAGRHTWHARRRWHPHGKRWQRHAWRPVGSTRRSRPKGRQWERRRRQRRAGGQLGEILEVPLEPRIVAMLETRHRHELCQRLLRVVRRIVVIDTLPASVAVAPPPLLETMPATALSVLDYSHEVILWQLGRLGGLHLELLLLHNGFMLVLVLLLHRLEELPLFVVLDDLHSGLFEAWQNLLLLFQSKPHRLALGERDLHRPQFPLIGNQHALLVKILNRVFGRLERAHSDKRTTDVAHRLGVDNEHLQNLSELLETLVEHSLRDLSRKPANEEFDPTLFALDHRTPVFRVAVRPTAPATTPGRARRPSTLRGSPPAARRALSRRRRGAP